MYRCKAYRFEIAILSNLGQLVITRDPTPNYGHSDWDGFRMAEGSGDKVESPPLVQNRDIVVFSLNSGSCIAILKIAQQLCKINTIK